jgi:signal transduction histidine kinase
LPIIGELAPDAANVAWWTRVVARSFIALGLGAAAWLPERRTNRHTFRAIACSSLVFAAFTAAWTILWASRLPESVDEATDSSSALVRDPVVLGFRLGGTILLLVAAFGFARKARINRDPVLEWVACGAVLLATARFHDFLFPSMHNDWVTTGDIFRVLAVWIVLGGVIREFTKIWRTRSRDARSDERRRLAAELHDGLAQELAYLTTNTALAERDPANAEYLARVRDAAERALNETRLRIAEYAQAEPVGLDGVIRGIARDVEHRYGATVVLELDEVAVPANTAHELGRVVREALANAARHGAPDLIRVRLDASGDTLQLTVSDDGAGMHAPRDAAMLRFGLTSMRERAERLGGSCSIVSRPSDGTRVAIKVPQR